MKEAIGGTWLFGIVVAFVVLFTTFISVSTNYSRSFRIKDDILSIIEHYHGVNDKSLEAINRNLTSIGYSSTGRCPDDGTCWVGYNTSGVVSGYGTNRNYCISRHLINKQATKNKISGVIGHPESAYYSVAVFFRLDWPILNSFFNINITGETSIIYNVNDNKNFVKVCG